MRCPGGVTRGATWLRRFESGRAAACSAARSMSRSTRSASAVEPGRQRGVFLRLHQTKMPLRHGQRGVALDRAEHFDANAGKAVTHQRGMTVARDLVEDHAGDRRRPRDSAQSRARPRRRIALAADTSITSTTGHPVAAAISAVEPLPQAPGQGDAVEQAHHALGQREIRVIGGLQQRVETVARHCAQESRLNDGRPAAIAMERRIDIVGSAFVGLHDPAAAAQRGEQRQRQRGLAAAARRARR